MENIKNEILSLNNIHTTWRDYCLMMLNSTAEPLRSIWREKITTSVVHWEFNYGSISDGNIAGMEILTVLPSELTMKLVDDYFEEGSWKKLERLNRSKRMNVFVGRYLQESASNEANICLKYLIKNWDNYVFEGKTGRNLIMDTPLLRKMWDLSQNSKGKCITSDELLTYILEKPVDDSKFGVWIDASDDIFTNGIPSDKYKDYWKSSKIDGYPFEISEDIEEQKNNFLNMCSIILREDVSWQACWKKICICILKNDVSMKYCGFGATLRERQAREDAMAAFSSKQEEKAKARENAEALAKKIEKENRENNN